MFIFYVKKIWKSSFFYLWIKKSANNACIIHFFTNFAPKTCANRE